MARPDYNHVYEIPFDWGPHHEEVQIVVRYHVANGVRERVCIGLQVRPQGAERWREVLRYDDAHGRFHRHAPGYPPGIDRDYLDDVTAGGEVDYALEDLEANADRYIVEAMSAGYEVRVDEDSAEAEVEDPDT